MFTQTLPNSKLNRGFPRSFHFPLVLPKSSDPKDWKKKKPMGMFTFITNATTNKHFDHNGEMSDPHLAAVRLSFTFCVLVPHC